MLAGFTKKLHCLTKANILGLGRKIFPVPHIAQCFPGFFESLIFVLAISSVLQNVNSIWNVLGYSGGFAVGTLVGLTIEERLALGYAMVQAISREAGGEIAEALREAGYGATEMVGQGLSGTVQVITTVANRREIATIARIVSDVDSSAFVTIDDANRVYRGYTQRPGHG